MTALSEETLREALQDAYRFITQPLCMNTPAVGLQTATYDISNYNALTRKLRVALASTIEGLKP